MTALCSGGTFGRAVKDTEITAARVCHFFMALRLDIFRPPGDFKRDMTAMLDDLNSLSPAEGARRVYYAGQKEHEAEAKSAVQGVPLTEGVWETLKAAAKELGATIPGTLPKPPDGSIRLERNL
jgi:LDH2 family malate/lactate/ureidoglycolate dehydrogenase